MQRGALKCTHFVIDVDFYNALKFRSTDEMQNKFE